jgi:NTE family protein
MAHLGVWKAIRELNIHIDAIGGTSMGAFLGGVMAFDWDFERIYEICKEIAHSRPSSDFNPIPYASLIRGGNLDKTLKKYYLEHDIEDCIIPFYCISTNLTTVSQHIHSHGNMFKAIRASGSLPGIVPPVPIKNHWHVDGGIIENFPVEHMVEMGMKKIIGVSFDPGTNPSTVHSDIPGLKSQILNGLFKTTPELQIPSVIETVMLSTTANSQSRQKKSEAMVDTLVVPDVSQYGLLEWKSFDKVVEVGYESAMREMEDGAGSIN